MRVNQSDTGPAGPFSCRTRGRVPCQRRVDTNSLNQHQPERTQYGISIKPGQQVAFNKGVPPWNPVLAN